jgi:uncharacterized membrane protein
MSATVTAGGAVAAGAVPLVGAALEAVSVCAHTPVVNAASVRAVGIRVLVVFMEVQSSSFEFPFLSVALLRSFIDSGEKASRAVRGSTT